MAEISSNHLVLKPVKKTENGVTLNVSSMNRE